MLVPSRDIFTLPFRVDDMQGLWEVTLTPSYIVWISMDTDGRERISNA